MNAKVNITFAVAVITAVLTCTVHGFVIGEPASSSMAPGVAVGTAIVVKTVAALYTLGVVGFAVNTPSFRHRRSTEEVKEAFVVIKEQELSQCSHRVVCVLAAEERKGTDLQVFNKDNQALGPLSDHSVQVERL